MSAPDPKEFRKSRSSRITQGLFLAVVAAILAKVLDTCAVILASEWSSASPSFGWLALEVVGTILLTVGMIAAAGGSVYLLFGGQRNPFQ
jgi:hypothetical protein